MPMVSLIVGDTPTIGEGRVARRSRQSSIAAVQTYKDAIRALASVFLHRTHVSRSLKLHRDGFAIRGSGLKELALRKPNMPASMFVGNDWILVFKSRTTAL